MEQKMTPQSLNSIDLGVLYHKPFEVHTNKLKNNWAFRRSWDAFRRGRRRLGMGVMKSGVFREVEPSWPRWCSKRGWDR